MCATARPARATVRHASARTSHLLAINHILKHFNVRYQLHGIGSSNRSKSGPGQGRLPNPEPALQRARIAREPDSSDEEQERVLELGRQGSDEL